jgi:hypothetical protein
MQQSYLLLFELKNEGDMFIWNVDWFFRNKWRNITEDRTLHSQRFKRLKTNTISTLDRLHNKLNSMGERPWKDDNHSNDQEIPRILWNLKIHYRFHKSPSQDTILKQLNTVHILPSYLI